MTHEVNVSIPQLNRLAQNEISRMVRGRMPQAIAIKGSPGIAKTDWAEEVYPQIVADGMGISTDEIVVHLFNPAEYSDAAEIGGPPVPAATDDGVIFQRTMAPEVQSMLEKSDESTKAFVIVIDEAYAASDDVLKVVTNMLAPRGKRMGNTPLPSMETCGRPTFVVLTGNRSVDKSGSKRLMSHSRNRIKEFVLNFNITAWDAWAAANDINPMVRGIMADHHSDILESAVPPEDRAICTPRSMVEVSYDWDAWEDSPDFDGTVPEWLELGWASSIGPDAARLVKQWAQEVSNDVPSAADIYANPEGCVMPDQTGWQLIAANRAIAGVRTMQEAESTLQYVMRMRSELIVTLGHRLSRLMATPAFRDEVVTTPSFQQFQARFFKFACDI